MSDPTPARALEFVKDRGGRLRGIMVPMGILLSIGAAAATGTGAGAKVFYGNLETRIAAVEDHQARLESSQVESARHIAVLEANAVNLSGRVDEMNRKLDTIIDLMLRARAPKDAP